MDLTENQMNEPMINQYSMMHIQNIYQAFVEVVIPRTPRLADAYGEIQYYGAADALIYEYLMLNLYDRDGMTQVMAIASLLEMDMGEDWYEIDALIRATMMGYYSEWFGYGSTRLNEPDDRVMEYQPFSWQQVGYPGPNRGQQTIPTKKD
jgi:hypothetical protein